MYVSLTYEPQQGAGVDARAFGYLLHKHPDKLQTFSSPVGDIHVWYPEASSARCTVALYVEVDPVALARNTRFRGDSAALSHYINDRPFAASSMLAVAIGTVFRSAMSGRNTQYPELAESALPLTIEIPTLSVRGVAPDVVERVFAPCGWRAAEQRLPADEAYPDWGSSPYVSVTLSGQVQLAQALRQLYVLLPVLDDAKHYWVNDDEIEKLTRNGEGWLPEHPERRFITERYLRHQRDLVQQVEGVSQRVPASGELERQRSLRQLRAEAVHAALGRVGARRVVDMGCGTGALMRKLLPDHSLTEIVGVDVSLRSLERAAELLHLRTASDSVRERVRLLHGSVLYRDERLQGYDALVLMEVIEHIDAPRLPDLEDVVFGSAAPQSVIVTTPNSEYNQCYPQLPRGAFRHDDHRFEWNREAFRRWAEHIDATFGYRFTIEGVGETDPVHGAATQMAVFERGAA